MKKILFFFLIFSFLSLKSSAQASEINPINDKLQNLADNLNDNLTGEKIDNFQSDITIQKDGSVDIKEKIIYFFDTPRHGIYRYIPYTLSDKGKRYDMKFKFLPVVDDNGKKYKSEIGTSDNQYFIKIGDANKTLTGEHTYIITYSIKGALRYFKDHDELYWNITGNGWDVPVKKAVVNINLPSEIKEADIKADCFTGAYESSAKNCTGQTLDGLVKIETTKFLDSNEGLTIAVGFPKGIVAVLKPVEYVPFFERWYGKITLAGIILAGILWYIVLPVYLVFKWFRHGRDPFVGIAVTAAFDPPKTGKRPLTPAECGALLDETVDKRDLFATIVDLARRGYLKITEPKEKQFFLTKATPKTRSTSSRQELQPFEATLYDGIFENGDSVELKKVKLYETAAKVEDMLYKLQVTNGYFKKNPKSTRSLYYALGGVALFTINLVLAFVAFVFGRFMPAKTIDGAKTSKMAEGLKNFLKSQERQLNFQGDRQMLFERLLPYAVAFGVEKQWAKRFEGFDLKNPDWYQGTSSANFNAAIFASSISHSYSNFAVSSTPPSSSSSSGFGGGGFSGGGGGGGGGGSW